MKKTAKKAALVTGFLLACGCMSMLQVRNNKVWAKTCESDINSYVVIPGDQVKLMGEDTGIVYQTTEGEVLLEDAVKEKTDYTVKESQNGFLLGWMCSPAEIMLGGDWQWHASRRVCTPYMVSENIEGCEISKVSYDLSRNQVLVSLQGDLPQDIYIEETDGSNMDVSYRKSTGTITFERSDILGDVTISTTDSPTGKQLALNATNFPDIIFREYVKTNFDKNSDLSLSAGEIRNVTDIQIGSKDIVTLDGIEYFYNLRTLNCGGNELETLDVSNSTKLISLSCHYNSIQKLDVSHNTDLMILNCFDNQMTELITGSNDKLQRLDCTYNELHYLDVSGNTKLNYLDCSVNELSSLDVSNLRELTKLLCGQNRITSLGIRANTDLRYLDCANGEIANLDISANTQLQELYCQNNALTSLNVSANTKLEILYCSYNALTSLDVSQNVELSQLTSVGNRYFLNDNVLDFKTLPNCNTDKVSKIELNGEDRTDVVKNADYVMKNLQDEDVITYQYDGGYSSLMAFGIEFKKHELAVHDWNAEIKAADSLQQAIEATVVGGAKLSVLSASIEQVTYQPVDSATPQKSANSLFTIVHELGDGITLDAEETKKIGILKSTEQLEAGTYEVTVKVGYFASKKRRWILQTGSVLVKPDAVKSDVTKPDTTKPIVTKPDTGKPNVPAATVKTIKAGNIYYKVTVNTRKRHEVAVSAIRNKRAGRVTIPSTVKKNGVTYRVTSIRSKAFAGCKKLTKVTIGKNVTSIGKKAFYNCEKLKTIKISSKVLKKVEYKAFKGIYKKATFDCAKKKVKAYKKLLKSRTGYLRSMKVK